MKLHSAVTGPSIISRRGPRLRAATFEDYEQIARLESRFNVGGVASYEAWSHLWLGSALFRELQEHWSIGWVLEDDDHRIVASIGNIPLAYECEGRTLLTATGRSWVAEPEHRSAALLLLDHVVNQAHVDLYVNNTVNHSSEGALEALQCSPVPVGIWNERVFWITRYRGVVESALRQRHYPLAKPLSYPLGAAVFLKDRLTTPALRAGGVEVSACPAFDDRFDDFWAELKRRNPHQLLAVRTREVLEWHYKYALLYGQLWIVTVVDGSRIVAYATFDRDRTNSTAMRLVDFQSLDGTTDLLPPLLHWAASKCREEGDLTLMAIGRWLEKGELLDRIAPHRRRLPQWIYFYRANDPALAERLRDKRAWAPSLFDGDASLVRRLPGMGTEFHRPQDDGAASLDAG
jgi:hypothetical protein